MALSKNDKQSFLIDQHSLQPLDISNLIPSSELSFIKELACKSFPVQSAGLTVFNRDKLEAINTAGSFSQDIFEGLFFEPDNKGLVYWNTGHNGHQASLLSGAKDLYDRYYTGILISSQTGQVTGCFYLVSNQPCDLSESQVQIFQVLAARTKGIVNDYLSTFQVEESDAVMEPIAVNIGNSSIDFTRLIQYIPFPVAIFDLDMRMLAASDSWLEAGQIHQKRWRGERFRDIYQETEIWEKRHLIARKGELLCGKEEPVNIPYFDTLQYINWQIRPWHQVGGRIGGTVMSLQNVTDSVLTKHTLQTALEYEEEAKKIKSEFLSNISHELRTPLNGILGFTGLALDTQTENTRQKYLEIVRESASKLLNIVNNVLDFSQLESGAVRLELRKVPLCEIVRQVVDVTAHAIHQKGLEMLVNFQDQRPLSVYVDPVRLKQILIILLENATKFTANGEVELRLQPLLISEAEGIGRIRFSVRDTGIGIGLKHAEKITRAFTQVEAPASKTYEGAGMGLAIASDLLKIMDSKLELVSTPGLGSEFYFDLELKIEVPQVNAPIQLDFINSVLIVDANQSTRQNIEEMLSVHSILCEHAAGAAEAIELVRSGKNYDVVIAQHKMSETNGIDLACKLKQLTTGSAPEIILLHKRSEDLQILQKNAEERAVRSSIQKPVRYQDLILSLSDLYRSMKDTARVSGLAEEPNINTSAALSVLMVEDNLVNMILLKGVLHKLLPHAELTEAGNGLVAVNICEQKLPDVVFMDVQMPVMNGLEATKAIRLIKDSQNLPIIALTAGNEKGAKQECLDAGMDYFLTKPYTPNDLLKILQEFDLV